MAKVSKDIQKLRYQIARELGFDTKTASKMRNWSDVRFNETTKRREKNNKRNEQLRQRRESLVQAGYTPQEARKLQYKSKATIDKAIEEKQRGSGILVVGYKEVTDYATGEELYQVKQQNKKKSKNQMVQSIMAWLQLDSGSGYIGQYDINIYTDIKEASRYLSTVGMSIAYKGYGEYLQPLIALCENMMYLLYLPDDKNAFIMELSDNLEMIGSENARKNARYLRDTFMTDTYDSFLDNY